ncbi:MAG: alpha/beta fold hydrolase [Bacteroidota bacterium]
MRLIVWMTLFVLMLGGESIAQTDTLPFSNSHFTHIASLRVHYREWPPIGPEQGRILLIHGFCCNTFSWRNNVQRLQEAGLRVVAIDLPPFGFSDRRSRINHSPSLQAQLSWRLLDQIDSLRQPWLLMGHSMGAAVAGAMSVDRPKQSLWR